jgi:hypothetical protein
MKRNLLACAVLAAMLLPQTGFAEPLDSAYTLDRRAGVVRFGKGAAGATPPKAATISATYRLGLGSAGNVPTQAVSTTRLCLLVNCQRSGAH